MGEKKYEELRWKNKEKNNTTAEIQAELEKKSVPYNATENGRLSLNIHKK